MTRPAKGWKNSADFLWYPVIWHPFLAPEFSMFCPNEEVILNVEIWKVLPWVVWLRIGCIQSWVKPWRLGMPVWLVCFPSPSVSPRCASIQLSRQPPSTGLYLLLSPPGVLNSKYNFLLSWNSLKIASNEPTATLVLTEVCNLILHRIRLSISNPSN